MKEQNRLVLVKGMGYLFACRSLVMSSVSRGGGRLEGDVKSTVVRLENTVNGFIVYTYSIYYIRSQAQQSEVICEQLLLLSYSTTRKDCYMMLSATC